MKQPKTIKECKEMIDKGLIPPLSKQERENIIRTRKQQLGVEKMKEVKDMTNMELMALEQDIKDSKAYVEENIKSYGILYSTAKSVLKKLESDLEIEKQKRNML